MTLRDRGSSEGEIVKLLWEISMMFSPGKRIGVRGRFRSRFRSWDTIYLVIAVGTSMQSGDKKDSF